MQPDLPYRNRSEAGRLLAEELAHYKSKADVVVLGLTRGGVPVAAEVASSIHAPLDVVVVRKVGVPFEPELAMGAIAGDDTQVLDKELVRAFNLTDQEVEAVITRERAELQRRERLYRGGYPALNLKGRTAILVDDGLATGSTMLSAVAFARKRLAKRIVMAVPVASVEALEKLREKVDECVCLATPDPFFAVGDWYSNFLPTEDADVLRLLEQSAKRTAASVVV
ncbi:MAG: phosphoribosyltransferase [Bryobacteraceae bacterium]